MIKWALCKEKIKYSIAKAEKQPFGDGGFDLITVCSGIHWFNIDLFLDEANRLLKSNKWLVVYDNFFISEMEGVEEFSHWYPNVYLKKFPAPKRNNTYDWTNENLLKFKFILEKEETFKNPIHYTMEELILYLTTQSNITAAVEKGELTYEEVETWLKCELTPFFTDALTKRTIYFGNWIKYLHKSK
jgi:SAM-dependent methyltransferase